MHREVEMRVTVIGAGRMGAIRVEDLVADPRVDEVLVANRTEARGADLAARHGATHVPWADAAHTGADATVVAVGTDAHGDLLDAVLRHGRPVLCEKPIALTLAGTAQVIATAEAHGAPLQIGFQRRFDTSIRVVRDRIATGGLGVLYSMTMTAHDHTPSPREFIAGSGGIFRDMHVHDLDLVRWLTGSEIATVYATKAVREHTQYAEFADADVSSILAVTISGVQVLITGARHDALGHDVRLEVHGSADSVSAGLNPRTPLHAVEGDLPVNVDPYTGFVDRFRDAFRHETQAFVSLVGHEIANPCPPDSALESLRAAIACEESVARGRPVALDEITTSAH
jgi:myo-inositol 2-dehydrogenase / D-chiro-inositol 1-dehydrogenase